MPSPMTGSAKIRSVNRRFFIVFSLWETEATDFSLPENKPDGYPDLNHDVPVRKW
jgi:hypothetical protein